MACLGCIKNKIRRAFKQYKKPVNTDCPYTLEELKELSLNIKDSYLTSQINVYHVDCKRYKKQIDELFKSIS